MDIDNIENKNRPAFPTLFEDEHGQQGAIGGLTKREYVATLALQGILANSTTSLTSIENNVRIAIKHTDEFLKQLKETK